MDLGDFSQHNKLNSTLPGIHIHPAIKTENKHFQMSLIKDVGLKLSWTPCGT